jgi:hypothetical protein
LSNFADPKFPKELLIVDSGEFIYLNPKIFRENFDEDLVKGSDMVLLEK